jgi:hypothetical protein
MVKSIARTFHWPPNVLGGLFIDDWDMHGLVFWYNDTKDQVREIEASRKKKDK